MIHSLILRTATRLLVSLILVFSVYLLLRGHNATGGGFAGALVAGTGFALFTMVEGSYSVRQAIRIDPRGLIFLGISLAIGSGLLGLFVGKPFLTGLWWSVVEIENLEIVLGTPIFFDFGVFFIVLGTILSLILALEEE